MVEVPNVVGKTLDEARMVLSYANLTAVPFVREGLKASGSDKVTAQQPEAGTKVVAGGEVRLDLAARPKPEAKAEHYVVVIDPGHQQTPDVRPEPIGPGSTETKQRVLSGTVGVATRKPEYKLTLEISMRLKAALEAQGVEVVMVRTTNDVSISNSQRAEIGNKAGADLVVRVHADGSPNQSTTGISTLYPGLNEWTKPVSATSKKASAAVQAAVVAATGAKDRGIVARTDMTGFNWSKVPSVIVETGFMSNPAEDRLLSTPAYQEKLATGMTRGILAYLKG